MYELRFFFRHSVEGVEKVSIHLFRVLNRTFRDGDDVGSGEDLFIDTGDLCESKKTLFRSKKVGGPILYDKDLLPENSLLHIGETPFRF